jgi:hypothetical protein
MKLDDVKPLSPALDDAPCFALAPVCPTIGDFNFLMARYPAIKQKAIARAWARLQLWNWKFPQRVPCN